MPEKGRLGGDPVCASAVGKGFLNDGPAIWTAKYGLSHGLADSNGWITEIPIPCAFFGNHHIDICVPQRIIPVNRLELRNVTHDNSAAIGCGFLNFTYPLSRHMRRTKDNVEMLSPLRKLACRQCHRTHFGFTGTAFRHDDGRTVPVDFALHCFGHCHLCVIQMVSSVRPNASIDLPDFFAEALGCRVEQRGKARFDLFGDLCAECV